MMKPATLYGLIHKGAQLMLASLGTAPNEMDGAYRDWLHSKTGKRSCKELTSPQLDALVRELKRDGWLTDYRPGGRADNRPTDAQWRKLAALCHELDWDKGLDDPALDRFCMRTAHVASARFLTKALMSQVITGLERWIAGGFPHETH